MKVLYLLADSILNPFGGLGIFTQNYLKDNSNEFIVLCPSEVESNYGKDLIVPVNFDIFTDENSGHSPAFLNQLNFYRAALPYMDEIDLIHAADYSTGYAAMKLSQEFNKPFIFSLHLSQGLYSRNTFLLNVEISIMHQATKIVHVSKNTAKFWQESLINLNYKTEIVPNGIEPFWKAGRPLLKSFNSHKINIGYIGRTNHQKGSDLIINALLSDSWPENAVLHYAGNDKAGDGTMWRKLEAIAKDYPDRLVMHGFLTGEDKYRFLQGCDIGLVPSRYEPFGLVGLEWMEACTTLITTGVEGIGDYANESNAIICTENNLLDAIYYCINNSTKQELSNAIDTVKNYTWQKVRERYNNIYIESLRQFLS